MAGDARRQELVVACRRLAESFDLACVAEQVEDADTVALLRASGITIGQGYHLGRPGPLPGSREAAA